MPALWHDTKRRKLGPDRVDEAARELQQSEPMLARFVASAERRASGRLAVRATAEARQRIRRRSAAENVPGLERTPIDQVDRGELLAALQLSATQLERAVGGADEHLLVVHADKASFTAWPVRD